MKKRAKYMIIALAGVISAVVSCQKVDLILPEEGKLDGYRTIEFKIDVPEMTHVHTKAVDPDGGGVQKMTVFCFDENSLFITTVTAQLAPASPEPSLTGTFKVTVPDHTETMHLVGNQNLTYFNEDSYRGMSEVGVMSSLEASAGRMIYWARKTITELQAHNTPSNPVRLLRNQAKVTLSIDNTKTDFVEKGWILVNTNAFGTVAPYSPEYGGFVTPTVATPFVTIPENNSKLGDFLDVRTNSEEYIFETMNNESDPIDFILKGSQNGGSDLYYRISLLDENGNNVKIMRNHHYTVNVVGELYYGSATFQEALEAPATNNVWVSISDNIAEVMDSDYRLAVDNTSVVIAESDFKNPNIYFLHYTLESLGGDPLTTPQVTWMEGNNVAMNTFLHTMDASGRGTIEITLNDMGAEQLREGTLFIKAGRLSRKIKVITVKEQTFEPAWITTNIYGVGTEENVTMMFTIPDNCPEELFPMEVLISVNALDIRNESGMKLPVIRQGEEGYGEDNGIGYKYVLTVNGVGKQRVYLETILEQETGNTTTVTIEAEHFTPLSKIATFRDDTNYSIILDDVRYYTAEIPEDEVIFYYLVPQKIGALVNLETHLAENAVWNTTTHKYDYTPVTANSEDKFLFYSRNLDHNEDPSLEHYYNFIPVNSSEWGTGGRVHSFTRTSLAPTATNGAVFYLKTNTPKSAEVVRISSDPASTGNQYRSAVFELSNYHPFHFGAQINGEGTVVTGNYDEVVDNIQWSYVPGQDVYIDIDVTSFTSSIRGNDNTVLPIEEQVSVDPFGTAFDIYIDAPMLRIDETSDLYTSGKVEKHPTIDGRFIYHVDASRDVERGFGTLEATEDVKTVEDQTGERKRLHFKTRSIVSAGEIKISSDQSKVVYYDKVFKVQNSSMVGKIQFRKDGTTVEDVPTGSFIPFEVEPTYNRIGTVTVNPDGVFELRLRGEYEYDWNTDNVKLQYTQEGKTYEKTFGSLNSLYSSMSSPIILELVP